ncbi:MAG: hypothetical protein GY851_13890 [bacterium]|nr:hypothetical protein [bacterium]
MSVKRMGRAVLIAATLASVAAHAADGDFVWARAINGSLNAGHGVAVDASGSVYTTGFFQGPADFDPGPGEFRVTPTAWWDIYVLKLDPAGNFVWAKTFGGMGYDSGSDITVGAADDIFVTGSFGGTVDFDPGPGTHNLTSAGYGDVFVLKLDNAGNFAWASAMGGVSSDAGTSVTEDTAGNIYVTGAFQGTADFDPGPGTYNLTSAGNTDMFVLKLDSAGNLVWARAMGGTFGCFSHGVAVDAVGSVYTSGFFHGTADFDPGPGTYNLSSAGSGDVFVSKLDSAGSFVWAKSVGGTSSDKDYDVVLDGGGSVFTTGQFQGTVDFDPGPGTYNLSSAGSGDVFVLKLDSGGNFVWVKAMGGHIGTGHSIALDSGGSIYTTGRFEGVGDFDPGAGVFNLTPAGNADIFVSKLDSAGDFVWAKAMGGALGDDYAESIAVDASGNVCTTGRFGNGADFDPGPGTYNLTSVGSSNIFVSKLSGEGDSSAMPIAAWPVAVLLIAVGIRATRRCRT